jgi:hypothetical protein
LVATTETYKGATVWKQTLTPLTANGVSWLSNGNNPGIGAVIWGAGGGLANRFTGHSIFFKPTVPMNGVPIYTQYSNIPGYQSSTNYNDMGDGWFRANVIWYDTVTRSDGKFWAINPLSSTLNTPIDIYWAGPFKEDRNDSLVVASFVNGTRGATPTDALVWLNYQSNMTVANSNYPSIVTDGLVLNMDAGFVSSYPKTGTSWVDLSGSGNSGTLVNGPTFSSENGGIITFDGTNESVEIPQSSNLDLLSYTYSFWIKRNVGSSDSWLQFLQRSTSNRNPGIWFYISEANRIHFSIILSNGVNTSVNPSGFFQNEWHHFTATVNYSNNNTTIIAYRNGVQVDSVSHNGVSPVLGTGGSFFGRQLMDVTNLQIYNRALTPSEVLQNYNAGLQRFIPTNGLVLSLDAQNTNLYATSATTAYDVSGNNYNGSLLNGVTRTSDGDTSWSFDGVDDRIVTTLNTLSSSTTWSVWAKRTQSINGYNMVMGMYLPYFAFMDDGSIHFSNNINGQKSLYAYVGLTNNVWYNVTFVSSFSSGNTTMLIYLNGALQTQATYAGQQPTTTSDSFRLGTWWSGNSEQFKGNIGNVSIYNRALSATEISTIYNATKSRYGL